MSGTILHVEKSKSDMQKDNKQKEQMFEKIEEWKASNCTQMDFCKQQGIRYHIFHYWYKVYRHEQNKSTDTASSFIALQLQREDSTTTNVELLLPDGKRLWLHGRVDAGFLRLLLQ